VRVLSDGKKSEVPSSAKSSTAPHKSIATIHCSKQKNTERDSEALTTKRSTNHWQGFCVTVSTTKLANEPGDPVSEQNHTGPSIQDIDVLRLLWQFFTSGRDTTTLDSVTVTVTDSIACNDIPSRVRGFMTDAFNAMSTEGPVRFSE